MTQEHPITPSEDQIMLWCKQWNCTKEPGPIHKWLAIQAARWGADQELEACCKWLPKLPPWSADDLRRHRRPKPPSLKQQALQALAELAAECYGNTDQSDTIRRALEKLDD
jgi:hypothetical protein